MHLVSGEMHLAYKFCLPIYLLRWRSLVSRIKIYNQLNFIKDTIDVLKTSFSLIFILFVSTLQCNIYYPY